MDRKLLIVSFFAVFGSYLIFSIPFAHAFFVGDAVNSEKKISLAPLTPQMRILIDDDFDNEFEPFDCEAEGYLEFVLVPENIHPNSYVTGNETYIHDSQMPGTRYDISPALSCLPTTDLISSQEIFCKIDLEYIASHLPYCPLGRSENTIEIKLDFMSDQGFMYLSASKDIVITDTGLEPAIKIVPEYTPEGKLQDINCKTGSILEVPVSVTHAEVFGEALEWTFYVNSTTEYNTLECDLAYESWPLDSLKEEIYYCEVYVYNSTIPYCTPGESVTFGMKARSGDYELDHNTTVELYSQDLNLGLRLTSVPSNVECQAINLEGNCVPDNPQRTFKFHITNAPKKLDVYKFSAAFNGAAGYVLCEKTSGEDYVYECDFVLPAADLQGDDPDDPINFDGSFPFEVTVETRFLNSYYKTLTDSSTISYSGTLPSDLVDMKKELQESKDMVKKMREDYEKTMKALNTISKIICCCKMASIVTNILKEAGEKAIEKAVEEGIFEVLKQTGKAFFEAMLKKSATQWLFTILGSVGVGAVECTLKAQEKLFQDAMDKLDEFEGTDDPAGFDADIPCVDKDKEFHEYIGCVIEKDGGWGKCVATTAGQRFMDSISCGSSCLFNWPPSLKCIAWVLGCIAIIVVLVFYSGGTLGSIISLVCGILDWIIKIGTLVYGFIMMLVSMLEAKHQMLLTQNLILLQQQIQMDHLTSMEDWMNINNEFITKLQEDTLALALLQTAFNPPSASLFFRSMGGSLIEYNETYCFDERLQIEYDFQKLNVTESFAADLGIYNRGSYVKTLAFPGINGTYGPQKINNIIGANRPTGEYDFVMDYGYGSASYKLYYINHTCM